MVIQTPADPTAGIDQITVAVLVQGSQRETGDGYGELAGVALNQTQQKTIKSSIHIIFPSLSSSLSPPNTKHIV